MPSSNAPSSPTGEMANDLRVPSTSVNQSRTMRTPRSSTVRSTYSRWRSRLSMSEKDGGGARRPASWGFPVHSAFTLEQQLGNGLLTASRSGKWERIELEDPRPMPYKAEYIWIDGTEPTAKLRSKTKIVADGAELPIWGFDGSSTNQAPGDQSDCVLSPVFSCPDPIRGGDNVLVMTEVLDIAFQPHFSHTRA